jgi:hypothetical protein
MTQITDSQLIQLAAGHKLGIFFCGKSKRAGLPFIQILRSKSVLAEFASLDAAAAWFPKIAVPDAAGNSILKSTAHT